MSRNIESQAGSEDESQESKENLTSTINVYAIETTKTEENFVSKQGFGHTEKLKSPQRSVSYHWEGKLHNQTEDYVGSSGGRDSIEDLAENFSDNYMTHQNPKLKNEGKPSYGFSFTPPQEAEKQYSGGKTVRVRGLSGEEQERFLEAFKKANKKAVERK